MIHRIKALYDEGRGLSVRAISRELGISRNTVRKYLAQSAEEIVLERAQPRRSRRLDEHRPFIEYLLRRYPKLSAVKVARKLREKVGELEVSDRTLRRYLQQVRERITVAQPRYYEPVLDTVPGVQCQIDPGEVRGIDIGGEARTVYFVVFVLSYSRLMHVAIAFHPIDTETFIAMHDEALRTFGGVPEECVYDQTKMVVIAEQFRELTVNERFHAYASAAGFHVHACRGYDPESKGKVEAGVKYVKRDCLYGERFADEAALRGHVQQWLDEVANVRVHGTTGRQPQALFDAEEAAHLRPYLTPSWLGRPDPAMATRKVDKTGLIAWSANKYSVPMAYQRGQVGVQEDSGQLHIADLETGEIVATHTLAGGKGQTVRNRHHYRDRARQVAELEAWIAQRIGADLGERLCARLRWCDSRIYRDQVVAVSRMLEAEPLPPPEVLERLATTEGLTATRVREFIEASQRAEQRGRDAEPTCADDEPSALSLTAYGQLGQPAGQEVSHEPS
ncbi:IS21 family transposase [Halorhodospira halophila]|uniref:IS21 family transposase n=1 Tax=Halorhodospira halophila TaxID=1053 RepID=UPI0019125BA1|nr:IS21 family transposase [Halorhodospira halophila]MBK5936594.1 transposase [Halorhodospira halophila]